MTSLEFYVSWTESLLYTLLRHAVLLSILKLSLFSLLWWFSEAYWLCALWHGMRRFVTVLTETYCIYTIGHSMLLLFVAMQ